MNEPRTPANIPSVGLLVSIFVADKPRTHTAPTATGLVNGRYKSRKPSGWETQR